MDFAMPYLINVMREYVTKVNKLEDLEKRRGEENETNESKPMMNMIGEPQLMITAGPGMMGPGYPNAGYANNINYGAGMPSYQGYSM